MKLLWFCKVKIFFFEKKGNDEAQSGSTEGESEEILEEISNVKNSNLSDLKSDLNLDSNLNERPKNEQVFRIFKLYF